MPHAMDVGPFKLAMDLNDANFAIKNDTKSGPSFGLGNISVFYFDSHIQLNSTYIHVYQLPPGLESVKNDEFLTGR